MTGAANYDRYNNNHFPIIALSLSGYVERVQGTPAFISEQIIEPTHHLKSAEKKLNIFFSI